MKFLQLLLASGAKDFIVIKLCLLSPYNFIVCYLLTFILILYLCCCMVGSIV